ncbi:MAG: hypothetical protein IJ763_05760 [Lachnospiraceae bacterium]|nr:hypothetical protein [Lachnospiraceae bacterium]
MSKCKKCCKCNKKGGQDMYYDELVSEISLRCDLPIDEVADVLDEEENIIEEERRYRKRKKHLYFLCFLLIVMMTAAVTICILDRQEKIDIENTVRKYLDKMEKLKEEYLPER